MNAPVVPPTLPASVSEVAGGKIFAIGTSVPASACRAWIAPGVQGFIPIQCYVLRDAGELIMLDGSFPAVAPAIREGLAALAPGATKRRFMMTRRELDTILNLPWIAHDFKFDQIYCGGDLSPIDFFEKMDDASFDAQIATLAAAPFGFLKPGVVAEIGSLRLEMVRASLMVLPTFWFYEQTTRTLFSSDCWGVVPQRRPTDPRIVTPVDDEVSADRIRDFLDVKFDWLAGIDNRPLAQDLERLFAERPIDRVCPNLGCIIEGRAAVGRLLEQTLRALAEMAKRPWRSPLAGWSYRPGDVASAKQ